MEGMQKRKANVLSAAQFEAALGGSAGSAGSAYMDSDTGPRRVNGKIVPRHLIVFHIKEDKVIHLKVEITVSIGAIYAQIKQYLGFDVTLHQTIKKKEYTLDPNEIAEDGMHFGYSVDIKRAVPVQVERTKDGRWTKHEIPGVLRAAAPALPGVARAKHHVFGADENLVSAPALPGVARAKHHVFGADENLVASPPAESAKRAKSAKKGSSSDPPPAWAPRGGPGGYMLAQAPRKPDADGNLPEIEYTKVYWHQGM